MPFQIVVIGGSLGSLNALELLLSGLPQDFPLPVAVVLHRSAASTDMLKVALQRHSVLRVQEAQDKDAIRSGYVYVAPADYHLMVESGAFALSTEAPVRYARPCIDLLFETAADYYGRQVVGVVLTGASDDGARGSARIKQHGGYVIVQDPDTAESPMMPRSAINRAPVDEVLPLPEIAPCLANLCRAR